MIKVKLFVTAFFLCHTISGCTSTDYMFAPEYTKEQCNVVRKNFHKLKIGMTKAEVLPLIGGERKRKITRNPGNFKEQKVKWEIYPLCYEPESCVIEESEEKVCYEWQMIAFDTKTNKVVKIFSDDPEWTGFF